jgi:hypothetical protein
LPEPKGRSTFAGELAGEVFLNMDRFGGACLLATYSTSSPFSLPRRNGKRDHLLNDLTPTFAAFPPSAVLANWLIVAYKTCLPALQNLSHQLLALRRARRY